MSITIELPARLEKILLDEAQRLGKTPGEIASEHLVALYDTRTDKEQAIDAHFAQEKAKERAKRERLVIRPVNNGVSYGNKACAGLGVDWDGIPETNICGITSLNRHNDRCGRNTSSTIGELPRA